MYHPFSIGETIQSAWKILKKNFVPLVVYSLISLFIYEVMNFFNTFIFVGNDKLSILLVGFVQMVIQCYLALSFYKLILTLMDREFYEFEFKDIIPSFKMTLNFVLIGFMYAVLIAMLLFINVMIEHTIQQHALILNVFRFLESILILYLLLRSIFCVCFIVDDGSNPIESLKQSFEATKDNFFKTLAMFLIVVGFVIALLIPVIIISHLFNLDADDNPYASKLMYYCWVLLAFPAVQVLIMVTYRKLVYSHKDVDDNDFLETN